MKYRSVGEQTCIVQDYVFECTKSASDGENAAVGEHAGIITAYHEDAADHLVVHGSCRRDISDDFTEFEKAISTASLTRTWAFEYILGNRKVRSKVQ